MLRHAMAGGLLMCLLVSGCTASGATKAGPGLPPVSLRLATVEAEGAAYTEDVERFVGEVDRRSDGAVQISVDWMAVPWKPDSEQELLDQALDAQLELVLLPTRVFDLRDIEVFQALQAPLLIDSAEVAGTVATSPTAESMLAALEPHGLVGLGLVYEGLRHPVAYSGAIDEVGDFAGLPIRVPASRGSVALFEALGARPVHSSGYAYDDQGGPVYAAESDFAWAKGDLTAGTVTAGASFFPKYLVLTAPRDVFERLTTAQQEVLRRAAATTVEQAVETGADEERRAAEYCEGGGSVLVASDAFRTALRTKLAPVVNALQQDAGTRRWMMQISAIEDGLRPEPFRLPGACAPRTGDAARLPSPIPAPMP